jgi:hypothetical protein
MPFKDRERYNAYMREYGKKTNQNAYRRDYRRRRKKELDSIVAEWTMLKERKEAPPDVEKEQQTNQIQFKRSGPPDLEKLQFQEENRMQKSQIQELKDRCTFLGLLLANYERRTEVLELLVASSSQARKR